MGKRCLTSVLTLFFFSLSRLSLGDGMLMKFDDDRFGAEVSQTALISYEKGRETLIVSIGIASSDSAGQCWIFPVPAPAEKATINNLAEVPKLEGLDVLGRTQDHVGYILGDLTVTQFWPILLYIRGCAAEPGDYGSPNVKVAGHVEKEDLTTELLAPKTSEDLVRYLTQKGLKVNPQAARVLDRYTGHGYSFVVTWLTPSAKTRFVTDLIVASHGVVDDPKRRSRLTHMLDGFHTAHFDIDDLAKPEADAEKQVQLMRAAVKADPSLLKDPAYLAELKAGATAMKSSGLAAEERAVCVTFPTDDLYFPLVPTSVYGKEIVPATLRIVGWQTPVLFDQIKTGTEVGYYETRKNSSAVDLPTNYTKIEIKAPASAFVDDLWIKRKTPERVTRSLAVYSRLETIGLLIMTVGSLVASLVAGAFTFGNLRKNVWLFALLGLCNYLTLYGVAVATSLLVWRYRLGQEGPAEGQAKLGKWIFRCVAIPLLFFTLASAFMVVVTFRNGYDPVVDAINLFPFLLFLPVSLLIMMVSVANLLPGPGPRSAADLDFEQRVRIIRRFVGRFTLIFVAIAWASMTAVSALAGR